MKKKTIIIVLLFACSLSLVALLVSLQQILSQPTQGYTQTAILSSLSSLLVNVFGAKLIIDNYQNRQWKVGSLDSILGALSGFIYCIITILVLGRSWINSNGISSDVDLPLFLDVVITFLGTLISTVLGLFASTVGFISVCFSVVISSQLAATFSNDITPIIMAIILSFCLSIFTLTSIIAIYGMIFRSNKSVKPSSIKDTSMDENSEILLRLLDLGKRKMSLLSKGEIMAELKIDIQTADNLLKQAELGQLISVELDQESGIMKYRVHI